MEEKTTPLRARMIDDMRIRGMGEKARKAHIRAIKDFAGFLGRSPDTATPEDLRAYQSRHDRGRRHAADLQRPHHGAAVPFRHDVREGGDAQAHAVSWHRPSSSESPAPVNREPPHLSNPRGALHTVVQIGRT